MDKVDLWVFLDCVLDESFQELETYLSFREAEPNSNLIPTIAKRSPLLKQLKLNFKFMGDWSRNKSDWEPLIRPLNFLHNLTSLTLFHLQTDFEPNILSFIGKCCPSLSHLCLKKGSHTTKHDVLAILLGELVEHLIGPKERIPKDPYWQFKKVNWAEDVALGRLRVPSEFLAPVCFTLRHLELAEDRPIGDGPVMESTTAAFILRHLPLLEKLEFCSGTEKGIQLLHVETEEAEEKPGIFQEGFEKACRDVIQRHGLAIRNPNSESLRELPSFTFSGRYQSYYIFFFNLS